MGAYRCICDRCGGKRWNDELRKEWNGLRVCKVGCFETRHPQDFVRGKADRQRPPWTRPEPADVFLTIYWRRTDGTIWNRASGYGWERTSEDVPPY